MTSVLTRDSEEGENFRRSCIAGLLLLAKKWYFSIKEYWATKPLTEYFCSDYFLLGNCYCYDIPSRRYFLYFPSNPDTRNLKTFCGVVSFKSFIIIIFYGTFLGLKYILSMHACLF